MIQELKKLAKAKGYKIYDEPFKLNIWGFRSNTQIPNAFDDEIHLAMNIGTLKSPKWFYMVSKATTDPGTFWLKNPSMPSGTAILHPGQYENTYSIDLHRGKYKALCQRLGAVEVIRDHNRDSKLDFDASKKVKGWYGINIHRASQIGSTLTVDKYSAGCQVFQSAREFDFFMYLCELHRAYHGNKFTYTLVDTKQDKRLEERKSLKALSIGLVLLGLIIGGAYYFTHSDKGDE